MSKTTNPDTTALKHGKYKGKTPEEIADVDPKYLAERQHLCTRSLYLACQQAVEEAKQDAAEEAEYSRGYN